MTDSLINILIYSYKKLAITILLFTISMFCVNARADHLPEKLRSKGTPETTLAGINLKTTKLNDVISMYGPPTREKIAKNNPYWIGYVWELPQTKLEVSVDHGPNGTQIHDVYIEGRGNGHVVTSGSGLAIGDNINTIERIYGRIYQRRTLGKNISEKRTEFTGVTDANQRITFQWSSEEFTLSLGLDSNGNVSAMWLILPECYPDGCD